MGWKSECGTVKISIHRLLRRWRLPLCATGVFVAAMIAAAPAPATTPWSAVAVGNAHACGIRAGHLYCWGYDHYGQVGNGSGSSADVESPTPIGSAADWTVVSAGGNSTCAIRAGRLYCWGSDGTGEAGNGPTSSANVTYPKPVGTATDWTTVSAGGSNACGLRAGRLYCWGDDTLSLVGDNAPYGNAVPSPKQIGTFSDWTSVDVGTQNACAIRVGHLYCWGYDMGGGAGNGSATNATVKSPQPISSAGGWTKATVGHGFACAIHSGALYCWGSDTDGQLGNGSASSSNVTYPKPVAAAATDWTRVSAGGFHTCAIRAADLYCWGSDGLGEVGNGPETHANVTYPKPISTSINWTKVDAGGNSSCGIGDGHMYCWGSDGTGEAGNGPGGPTVVTYPHLVVGG